MNRRPEAREWSDITDEDMRETLPAWVMSMAPDLADIARQMMDTLDVLVPDGPAQIAVLLLLLKRLERNAPKGYPVARMRAALTAWVEERSDVVDREKPKRGTA